MSTKTKSIIFIIVALLIAVFVVNYISNKNAYQNAIKIARAEIWKDINSGKCANASVAIMIDGKIVYAEGFGMANREKSIPVDKNTLLNIGSISKTFVTVALMELVDQGKISLDKPVTDYLPEFKMADDRYKKITVRMLLDHTSGIPGTQDANSFGFNKYYENLQKETLETLSHSQLIHEPGTLAVYCNDGFTLAEMIVEKISGKKYVDFIKETIFKPLELKNTGVSVGETPNKMIAAYYDPKTAKKHPFETLSVLGAGGLSSTPSDLVRFADMFSSHKILSANSLKEMEKSQPGTHPLPLKNPGMSFGLGLDFTSIPQYESQGIPVIGKSGGTGNYSSMLFSIPSKRISVAVICSGSESSAMKIALDVLNAVLVGKRIMKPEEKPVTIPKEPQPLPKSDLAFAGYYGTGNQLYQIDFDSEKNNVTIYKFDGKDKIPAIGLIYNNDYYYDSTGQTAFYFLSDHGETYLVNYLIPFKIDLPAMQKVNPIENSKQLKINLDGKSWVRRNVGPFESVASAETHRLDSTLIDDLKGYVIFYGVKKIESPEFAGMPFDAIRDQRELTLIDKKRETWLQSSDLLYSPADKIIALKSGKNAIKIGKENYNEWRMVPENAVLCFDEPKNGRIIVFPPNDDEPIYDSAIDTGDVGVLKGSLIEMAGFAGDKFVVKAKSAK